MSWFLPNRQPPLHSTTFLDTCQKMVSTHVPQFRSNISVVLKLSLIMIANVRIDLCSLCIRHINFPFCPSNKDYKYLSFLLRQQYSIASPCLPFFSRTHLFGRHLQSRNRSTPLGFEDSDLRIIYSNNGVHLRDPRGTFTPFIRASTSILPPISCSYPLFPLFLSRILGIM